MIVLDRGAVVLASADAFATMLPEVPIPSLPFAGAYGMRVTSLGGGRTRRCSWGGLAVRRAGASLVARFPDELGAGAWIFVEDPAELPWRHSGSIFRQS